MTNQPKPGTYLRVSDLEPVFGVRASQAARIAAEYERVTGIPFRTEGKSKLIPTELLAVFEGAAAMIRKTPGTTHRTAFERAWVNTEVRRQRTTPTSLAAALASVRLAQEALIEHAVQDLPDRQNMQHVIDIIARLQDRTALLQRLLPGLDTDGPESWTPQQVHDLVTALKLLADATAQLLATDQMLYAHLQYWQGRDDRTHKVLKSFLLRWTELYRTRSDHDSKGPQETAMPQLSTELPADFDSDEASILHHVYTADVPRDEPDLLPFGDVLEAENVDIDLDEPVLALDGQISSWDMTDHTTTDPATDLDALASETFGNPTKHTREK